MEFLLLRMCTRDRISPPKNVHKSHIEMTKLPPLFVTNRQRQMDQEKGGKEMKI